jgi:hypothetical protein
MKVTGSGLLIPSHLNDEPRYVCNFPGCGWKGYTQREQVDHAMHHATQDEETIHELCKEPTEEILGPGDVEKQVWQKERYDALKKTVGPREALNPKRY